MKKLWIGGIGVLVVVALLLGLNLIVSAREEKEREEEASALQAQTELQLYKEQISKLETELATLKESQYATSKTYEEKIAELELKLIAKEEPQKAETPQSDAVFTYTVSNNKATITGCKSTDKTLIVPQKIDGLSVIEIGREAFKSTSFTNIILPEGLEKINWFAFANCDSLKSVTIPSSVNKIEYGVFDGVNGITVVCETGSYAHRYAKSYGFSVQSN